MALPWFLGAQFYHPQNLPAISGTVSMSEILSYLLLPLARLIYQSAPSKLRTALGNVGKTLTALEVAIALYAISLRYLPTGEFLGKIELPKPWQSITDPWDLLILLSIVVVVHHAGGKVAMNLKFLLQPTIDKIREDLRPQVREEVTAEVREEVTARRGPGKEGHGRKYPGHKVVARRTNSGREG